MTENTIPLYNPDEYPKINCLLCDREDILNADREKHPVSYICVPDVKPSGWCFGCYEKVLMHATKLARMYLEATKLDEMVENILSPESGMVSLKRMRESAIKDIKLEEQTEAQENE